MLPLFRYLSSTTDKFQQSSSFVRLFHASRTFFHTLLEETLFCTEAKELWWCSFPYCLFFMFFIIIINPSVVVVNFYLCCCCWCFQNVRNRPISKMSETDQLQFETRLDKVQKWTIQFPSNKNNYLLSLFFSTNSVQYSSSVDSYFICPCHWFDGQMTNGFVFVY